MGKSRAPYSLVKNHFKVWNNLSVRGHMYRMQNTRENHIIKEPYGVPNSTG